MLNAKRVVRRYLQAATTPVPTSFPQTEIGLMTWKEFLKFNNPEGKTHPSEAYDVSVMKLNEDYSLRTVQSYHDGIEIGKTKKGYLFKTDGILFAIFHNGTMYHSNRVPLASIPTYVGDQRGGVIIELPIKKKKLVKYIQEYMPLVSDVAKENWDQYPHRIQRIKIKGEYYEIRSEKSLVQGEGTTIAILNSAGERVASAQDEWGATLLMVAKEYRSQGLGDILGKLWFKWNPGYPSGGYSPYGERAVFRIWQSRVREFLSNGWYSELVRQGRLSSERMKEILSGIGVRKIRRVEETLIKVTKKLLFYVNGPTFVVYDEAFLKKQSSKFIYGYGFFRASADVGPFLYAIDYDKEFRKTVNYVALQLARDQGMESLYDGKGHYSDVMDLKGMDFIERKGDYVHISKDVLPLGTLAKKEKLLRRKNDPYGEVETLLLEKADSKWK